MFVSEIMTEKVHTIAKDTTLQEANEIFIKAKYHHLVIVEDNKLIGIISDRDVNRNITPYLSTDLELERDKAQVQKLVSDFMSTKIVSIDKNTPIDAASILLLENCISCLPIIDIDDQVEGILTWKDLLKYYVYAGD